MCGKSPLMFLNLVIFTNVPLDPGSQDLCFCASDLSLSFRLDIVGLLRRDSPLPANGLWFHVLICLMMWCDVYMSNFLKSRFASCIALKAWLARLPKRGKFDSENAIRILGFGCSMQLVDDPREQLGRHHIQNLSNYSKSRLISIFQI